MNMIISGNDKEVENLQLAFSNALNLKKNFLQLGTSKNERDFLSDLQDLCVLLQNHINSIEADKDIKYFDPIKSGVICVYNLDAKLKRKISNKYMDYLTKKISIPVNDTSLLYISVCDQYEFAYLIGEFDLGRNNRNAKDEKSLYELALVAEFGPIINESDLKILSEIYVFMIQVKKKIIETSVLDYIVDSIYRSKLLNRAEILLEKNNIDKVAIDENSSKLNKMMNTLSRRKQEWKSNNSDVDFDALTISEVAKKLVLSQAITTSTPTSSPSHNDTTSSQKSSITDLLELFLTPARAKETLKEMNTLLLLEIVVFTTDSNILLTPDRLPISTDDDDLISDIQI
ncbi:29807_t:CDS:2 [Racocetra persica]|uniref:29807_t:CDS:1 n=1 Tax=Racocetra persica TaxID=160502 RepID=A0ACA9LTD4_9GLOM|nr:29807_t:CDS:2 [Racocetra persica]